MFANLAPIRTFFRTPRPKTYTALALLTTTITAYSYDRARAKTEIKKRKENVKYQSLKPMQLFETPHKTIFYILKSEVDFREDVYFNEYVKPILDAASGDYELKVLTSTEIRKHIQQTLTVQEDKTFGVAGIGREAYAEVLYAIAASDKQHIPVGFIPSKPRFWLLRVWDFFQTRKIAERLADAAEVIAHEKYVKLIDIFPGDMEVLVQKIDEIKLDHTDVAELTPEEKLQKKKEDAKKAEKEVEHELVTIPEDTVTKMSMYHVEMHSE